MFYSDKHENVFIQKASFHQKAVQSKTSKKEPNTQHTTSLLSFHVTRYIRGISPLHYHHSFLHHLNSVEQSLYLITNTK